MLEQDIRAAINRHSAENASNTPDHILARYLIGCLEAFNAATNKRSAWYGNPEPAKVVLPPARIRLRGTARLVCAACDRAWEAAGRLVRTAGGDEKFEPAGTQLCPRCESEEWAWASFTPLAEGPDPETG